MRLIFFFMIMFNMSSLLFSSGNKELFFRPVTLKIVDYITGEALEGVKIYSIDVTFHSEELRLFGLLIGESKDIKTYNIREYVSDERGYVFIPEITYSVKNNHFIYEQSIYVNCETVESFDDDIVKAITLQFGLISYEPGKNEIFMPMKEYKAFRILNRPYPMDERWNQPEKTKPYFTQMNNGHKVPLLSKKEKKLEPTSFYCEEEEFIIMLEKQEE